MKTTILLFATVFIWYTADAQCKKSIRAAKSQLENFEHDGIYNTTVLELDETLIVAKTFYENQVYRIAVSNNKGNKFTLKILNADRELIYSNADEGYKAYYDLSPQKTEQFTILIQHQREGQVYETVEDQCVSVLVGFEPDFRSAL